MKRRRGDPVPGGSVESRRRGSPSLALVARRRAERFRRHRAFFARSALLLACGLPFAAGCLSDDFADEACWRQGLDYDAATKGCAAGGETGTGGGGPWAGGRGGSAAGAGGTSPAGQAGASGEAGVALVRVAHLAYDVGDMQACVRAASQGSATKLGTTTSFKEVSAYTSVPAGSSWVRLVASEGSCASDDANSLSPRVNVIFPTGGAVTLVARHEVGATASGGLTLMALADEAAAARPSDVALRLVHAADALPPLDVGVDDALAGQNDGGFLKLFADVTFANAVAATGSGVAVPVDARLDQKGYAPLPLLLKAGTDLEVRSALTGQYFGTLALPFDVPAGSANTVFVFGRGPSSVNGFGLLSCADARAGDDPEAPLSACVELRADDTNKTPGANVRFAQVSPDPSVATVDVCLKPSSSAWAADSSQAWVTGLAFPGVTTNHALRADSYDVKVFGHTVSDCTANEVFAKTGVVLTATTNVSWALSGALENAADGNAFDVRTLTNVDTTTSTTQASVRFFHALVNFPAIDAGTATATGDQLSSWLAVPFGGVSHSIFTPDGYRNQPTWAADTLLGIAPATGGDASESSYVSSSLGTATAAGKVYTVWAIGLEGSGSTQLLFCDDSDQTGTTLTCAALPLAVPAPP